VLSVRLHTPYALVRAGNIFKGIVYSSLCPLGALDRGINQGRQGQFLISGLSFECGTAHELADRHTGLLRALGDSGALGLCHANRNPLIFGAHFSPEFEPVGSCSGLCPHLRLLSETFAKDEGHSRGIMAHRY
jgi:hypothetical protein